MFRNLSITNGIVNDLEKLEAEAREGEELKASMEREEENRLSRSMALKIFENIRLKKSVQFADGIKPGEGTSPSGGEGDMPSPPPPSSNLPRDLTLDISKKLRARKMRKKQKRTKPPKTKKKVKVRKLSHTNKNILVIEIRESIISNFFLIRSGKDH